MIELERLSAIVELEGWGVDTVTTRVQDTLDLVRQELERLADARLGRTAAVYKRSIGPAVITLQPGAVVGSISLGGEGIDKGELGLAVMLEEGRGPFDMRPGLLPGRDGKAKTSKDGHLYRAIPFEHGQGSPTRGDTGRSPARPPLGSQFTRHGLAAEQTAFRGNLTPDEARKIGRDVKKAAKALEPTLTSPDPDTKTAWGGRLDAGLAPMLRPRHVTDIYAGMVRVQKTYERATEGRLMTFRMISNNPGTHRYDTETRRDGFHPAGAFNVMGQTAERNWTHPGFAPRRLFVEAADYLAMLISSGAAFGEIQGGGDDGGT